MKNIEQQQAAMKNHNLPQETADQTKPVDASRRHFTKSGLAVSGVLLTLASRSALAQVACKSPSGYQSGNVSQHGTPVTCSGLTPGGWQNTVTHPWPSPYSPGTCTEINGGGNCKTWANDGTMFNDPFLGFNCTNNGLPFASRSMMQVILLNGQNDATQLGSHIVAALLNAKKGYTPVLTEAQVRNIFNEWDQNGYFEPTAGVHWNSAEIVTYLQSTME